MLSNCYDTAAVGLLLRFSYLIPDTTRILRLNTRCVCAQRESQPYGIRCIAMGTPALPPYNIKLCCSFSHKKSLTTEGGNQIGRWQQFDYACYFRLTDGYRILRSR